MHPAIPMEVPMLDEDIDDETAEVIDRLKAIVENQPGSPLAALADGIMLLNYRIGMIHENVLMIFKRIKDLE
jgi:hypothetical protein